MRSTSITSCGAGGCCAEEVNRPRLCRRRLRVGCGVLHSGQSACVSGAGGVVTLLAVRRAVCARRRSDAAASIEPSGKNTSRPAARSFCTEPRERPICRAYWRSLRPRRLPHVSGRSSDDPCLSNKAMMLLALLLDIRARLGLTDDTKQEHKGCVIAPRPELRRASGLEVVADAASRGAPMTETPR